MTRNPSSGRFRTLIEVELDEVVVSDLVDITVAKALFLSVDDGRPNAHFL
jgi:hypothetical protein